LQLSPFPRHGSLLERFSPPSSLRYSSDIFVIHLLLPNNKNIQTILYKYSTVIQAGSFVNKNLSLLKKKKEEREKKKF
jgi:hypothetical protein